MTYRALQLKDMLYRVNVNDMWVVTKEEGILFKPKVKTVMVQQIEDPDGAYTIDYCDPKTKERLFTRSASIIHRNPFLCMEDPLVAISALTRINYMLCLNTIDQLLTLPAEPITQRIGFSPIRKGVKIQEFNVEKMGWKTWNVLTVQRPTITLQNRKEQVTINFFGQEIRDGIVLHKRFFLNSPSLIAGLFTYDKYRVHHANVEII